MNLSSCLFAAATTLGWVEPVLSTAIPEEKSMNRFPSTSVTTEPWADSTTSGASLAIDGEMTLDVLLMTALAFGPGRSPLTNLTCFLEGKYQSPRRQSPLRAGLRRVLLGHRKFNLQDREAQLPSVPRDHVLTVYLYLGYLHLAYEPLLEDLDHVDRHVDGLASRSEDYMLSTAVEHSYAGGNIVEEGLGLTYDYCFRLSGHGPSVSLPLYNRSGGRFRMAAATAFACPDSFCR